MIEIVSFSSVKNEKVSDITDINAKQIHFLVACISKMVTAQTGWSTSLLKICNDAVWVSALS